MNKRVKKPTTTRRKYARKAKPWTTPSSMMWWKHAKNILEIKKKMTVNKTKEKNKNPKNIKL